MLAALKPWLEDAGRPKLGQNIKYDLHVLANHGITMRGVAHDTMLQSYVLEAHLGHGLEKLAERHLGRKGLSYEDLCGKGVHQIPFAQVDVANGHRRTRARTARWRCSVHQAAVAAAAGRGRAAARLRATSRCRQRRCCSASSATAC